MYMCMLCHGIDCPPFIVRDLSFVYLLKPRGTPKRSETTEEVSKPSPRFFILPFFLSPCWQCMHSRSPLRFRRMRTISLPASQAAHPRRHLKPVCSGANTRPRPSCKARGRGQHEHGRNRRCAHGNAKNRPPVAAGWVRGRGQHAEHANG